MKRKSVSDRIKGIVQQVDKELARGSSVVKDKAHIPTAVWDELRQLVKDLESDGNLEVSTEDAVTTRPASGNVLLPPSLDQTESQSPTDAAYARGWNEAVDQVGRLNKRGRLI